jgi:hypothetical protein
LELIPSGITVGRNSLKKPVRLKPNCLKNVKKINKHGYSLHAGILFTTITKSKNVSSMVKKNPCRSYQEAGDLKQMEAVGGAANRL